MTSHALVSNNHANQSLDIEAQKPAANRQNVNVTRAKVAAMAAVGTAGVLATAYLSSLDRSNHSLSGGRTLANSGCSEDQLKVIEQWKKALIGSGIGTGCGMALSTLGSCLGIRMLFMDGFAATGLGGLATVISGIGYGVTVNKC